MSRERKKMYVKDIELKSRYLEGECRRLGMLLQCYAAENQALRLSSANAKAFDASMSKQEFAVLFLYASILAQLLLCCSESELHIFGIPAVGIPDLVPGHHGPVQSSKKPTSATKRGCQSSGKSGSCKKSSKS